MASSKDTRRLRPRPWINRPPTRQVDGYTLGEVVLLGARDEATISDAVLSAPLKATRKSAAQLTLTVADPERELLGPLLDRAEDLLLDDNVDTEIGGIWWRLMGVEPTDTGWTMSFEDRAGAWLRRHDKPIRVVRGRVTRARFIHRLYREAGGGIDLWVPELRDKQQIAKGTSTEANEPGEDAAAGATAGSGDGEWTSPPSQVRNHYGMMPFTPERRSIAARLLRVASAENAGERATLTMLAAALVESELGNPRTASADGYGSYGTFQPRVDYSVSPRGLGTKITMAEALDVEGQARQFLRGPAYTSWSDGGKALGAISACAKFSDMSVGQIAQKIEGSAHPDRYDKARQGAEAILKAFRGGALVGARGETDGAAASSGGGESSAYVFERGQGGKREDSLTCANRLADEVAWRHWIFGGQGYYASDPELINAPIVLRIDRDNPAVVSGPTWKWDVRLTAAQMRVELIADRLPEPGQVVYVRGEGPATGRWLIDSVESDLAQPVDLDDGRMALRCKLELARAQKKKEPAAAAAAGEGSSGSATSNTDDATSQGDLRRSGNRVTGGTARDRIVFAAKEALRLHDNGQRKSFYLKDASKPFTAEKAITGEPSGYRSDCSQWVIGIFWSAGLKAPDGGDYKSGWTGTLVANSDKVSSPLPGDLCFYGSGSMSHVELYIGDGKTIGHGSTPIAQHTPRYRGDFAGYYRPRTLTGG